MPTALVTGASGFIGGHLVEWLLNRGEHVRCLVRCTSKLELLKPLNVELVYGDVFQREALLEAVQGVDVVYHLAAMTCALRRAELYRVNTEGTSNVAQACAAAQPRPVLVIVSSVAATGPTRRGELRSENDPPAPVSHYGRSKRAGELKAQRYADRVPTTIVRPGVVFGERNQEMFPIFQTIDRFRVHLIPTFSPPPLSMIHIADLVPVLVAAAERGERLPPPQDSQASGHWSGQGTYFACVDEYPDYRQVGRLIAEALGRRHVRLWCLAEPLPWLVAAVNEVICQIRRRPDVLNIDKIREAVVDSWACSADKAREQLGLRAAAPLRERLAQTGRWYRDHGWL